MLRVLSRGSLAGVLCLTISGCDPVPKTPATLGSYAASNAVLSSQTETLTPDQMREVSDVSANGAYKLGPDDIISMTVYLHPELDVPVSGQTSNVGGALITSDGSVELPLIGGVHLGGLTLAQAQATVTAAYGKYLADPKVAIELQEAQSLRYYLLGAFSTPGIKYPVHQLTLLEALALGGSVDLKNADLYQAYVAQGSVKLPVDLYALLVNGDLSQNITLASGDTIVIPSTESENAFVFGAVGKPGAIPFQSGALSLLQALAASDMDLSNYTSARLARVHIIRAGGNSAQFMIVDARSILEGKAATFALRPGDIVFVPPTAFASWNQVLDELLPSLSTVAGILNPFVSIAYLRNNQI
jgi:polysaccharide export outer membrane protein